MDVRLVAADMLHERRAQARAEFEAMVLAVYGAAYLKRLQPLCDYWWRA